VRILAVCGSLQAASSNLSLLELAQRLGAPLGLEVVLFDGLRRLPHFDPDLPEPPEVSEWRRAIAESDALLIASPEYGHSLPGALKNAIDWVIGTGELEKKVVAITSAVPIAARGRMGLQALRQTLGAVSAQIVGGEPLVKGPELERELLRLLEAIAQTTRT
jgi:chromate reductase